jgi:hypothetical protein
MGVDANCFLGYGIFLNNTQIHEDYGDGFLFKYEDGEIIYNYNKSFEVNELVVIEPYSCAWTFVGVDFWDDTVEGMVHNLKKVHEDYEKIKKELLSVVPEGTKLYEEILNSKPEFTLEPYFS